MGFCLICQLLEDPLQLRRLKYVIDGPQPSEARDDNVEGMLGKYVCINLCQVSTVYVRL